MARTQFPYFRSVTPESTHSLQRERSISTTSSRSKSTQSSRSTPALRSQSTESTDSDQTIHNHLSQNSFHNSGKMYILMILHN